MCGNTLYADVVNEKGIRRMGGDRQRVNASSTRMFTEALGELGLAQNDD